MRSRRSPSAVLSLAFFLSFGVALPQEVDPEQEAAWFREVVEYLLREDADPNQQYQGVRYLLGRIEEGGRLPDELRDDLARFAVLALEPLGSDESEAARTRAALGAMVAPVVPTPEVRALLHQALVLHVEQIPWKDAFFTAVEQVPLTEALPYLEGLADEYGGMTVDELAGARFRFPFTHVLHALAVLGGDDQAPRVAPFLRPGVPPALRYHAVAALERMDGPRSLELLEQVAGEQDDPVLARAAGEALLARGAIEGARVLLRLSPDPDADPRAWAALCLAANRPFASAAEVEEWIAAADRPLPERRLAAFADAGYEVGDLTRVEHLRALLRAAGDEQPVIRRNAWDAFVQRSGRDIAGGQFWVLKEPRGDGTLARTIHPADRLTSAQADRLLEQQQPHLDAAAEWLDRFADRLIYDAAARRFRVQ